LGSSTPAAANVTTLGASGEVTATGFTGTLDGILGSGSAAAATTTTLASTTITASGIIKTDDTTAATSTTDGSLQTDGGLSVALDAVIGDDLFMLSDAAVLTFGADKDVTLTHVADTGILLNSTMAIQFNDASQYINAPSNAILDINATDEIELNATLVDINANVEISGNLTVSGTTTQVDTVTMNAENAVVFEGATADAHETTLTIIDPTADRTQRLINQSGYVPLLAAVTTTAITSTPAELNILDGATVVVGEINALDIGSTAVGTAVASKAVILDSSKDYTGIRNFTISGELDAATLDISGAIDVAGNSVLASVDVTGLATAATFEPDGDTAAGDNAAIGYTAAEGLILTGQGSTSDITLKNDADAVVFTVPTGTDDILFPDNAKAMFGDGSDLQIYHDGSHTRVQNNTGNYNVRTGVFSVTNVADNESLIHGIADGAVTLYHNALAKLATTSGGIGVTGAATFAATNGSTDTTSIDLGLGRSGNGYAFVDLIGDATYTDYGLRLIRNNGGANTTSSLRHRGTGTLTLECAEAADMSFETTNAERMRILAGGGLTFNGDTAAANALDDYEEGTWTPVVEGSTSGTRTMGAANFGFYTKVGNVVTLNGTMHVTGTETIAGNVLVTGLPFSSNTAEGGRSAGTWGTNGIFTCAVDYRPTIVMEAAASYFYVIQAKDEATQAYSHTPTVIAGINYGFQLTYRTA
jgi:hypothetical protein